MAIHGINLVLDVGANAGQYGLELRTDGFDGRIVSFEPLSEPFRELEHRARRDPAWECRRLALSDHGGTEHLNVSGFTPTSSLLEMNEWFASSAPQFRYVETEEVTLAPLDTVSGELIRSGDHVLLKLDVQGYELRVLDGAKDTLPSVAMLECEMSLIPLYDGDPGLRSVLDWLATAGFAIVGLEPTGPLPASGHVLQVNGIFVRSEDRLAGLADPPAVPSAAPSDPGVPG
jgi:FkbM family methyltransferase